jgi:formyl-CoA transferase
MQTRSTADWLDAFEENDIPVMPMHDMKSLIEDPHLQAVGFFGQMQHPSEGLLRSIRTPTHWSCAPLDEPSPAPLLGEHTRQILAQQGYDAESIDRLLSSGAVA